jgi:putative sigma-54 modulation protein
MKVSVTFRHMKTSDPIREYAEDRIDKITRLIDRGGEAQVVLSVEKHLHVAHIELLTEGALRIRSIEKSEDMYGSIDTAVEKIVRQVRRYREKIKSHREAINGRELPHQILEIAEEEGAANGSPARIVRTETIVAKEMNIDDAVMQMDLLHTDFLVFTNASSHQVNVVYRLPDGQYGLIEAHAA